ncbi:NAD-dependent epimerase/dehydratase family protein [Chryseosolibacter indicus]|uniref:NAD-dependent epimerase/dehydratase family protein n=1 Tax=Chryseosolibacter indicus TaxID=2782351 RepID=A0ABS5VWT3_9BACT|nr:NAD-dependent epimerase/dehydratase family protein [Chryseosolibacter indicus]MBT1705344.1 NAD-dependent epimerase/dehydratase family protein [Chryseosolibacter indicus]
MKIFITGVSGFAGSSLVRYFNDVKGVSLVGHSREVKKATEKFKGYNIEIVPDYSIEVFNRLGIDCIIHLAGIAHDLSNTYGPSDYYEVNNNSTRRLYDEFLQSNVKKFIFISSIKAAVDTASSPVDEGVEPSPVSDYGKSKFMAEQYIQQQKLSENKSYYIFRPCMIHGPGNKGNLNLLYKFVKARLPYPFGGFRNKRSFLSVDNFTFIVHEFTMGNYASGIYHLADDGYLSTTELYKIISKTIGINPISLNIPPAVLRQVFNVIGKRRMLDKLTEDMMVSNEKVVKAIGKPLPIGIEEGVRRTINSF